MEAAICWLAMGVISTLCWLRIDEHLARRSFERTIKRHRGGSK